MVRDALIISVIISVLGKVSYLGPYAADLPQYTHRIPPQLKLIAVAVNHNAKLRRRRLRRRLTNATAATAAASIC